jgi:hypothetical protein
MVCCGVAKEFRVNFQVLPACVSLTYRLPSISNPNPKVLLNPVANCVGAGSQEVQGGDIVRTSGPLDSEM